MRSKFQDKMRHKIINYYFFILNRTPGADVRFYGDHLRKKELEQIAGAISAELILLTHDKKEGRDEDVEVKD